MTEADLIVNPDGSMYHLGISASDIADKVILVGDPARVDKVALHFDQIELTREHREFRTITGQKSGQRLTVMSTGIGPDNIDIVWNELDALANYDPEKRQYRSSLTSLKVIRLGTCGGLQPEVPVGSLVHSRYGIGGDAMMQYYQPVPGAAATQLLGATLPQLTRDLHPDHPPMWYPGQCDEGLHELISSEFTDVLPGITFTAAGFYGPQGRQLGRIPLRLPRMLQTLQDFQFDGFRVLNLEMETAAIMALGQALGHRTGAISVILAQREAGKFHPQPAQAIEHLIEVGLKVVLAWA